MNLFHSVGEKMNLQPRKRFNLFIIIFYSFDSTGFSFKNEKRVVTNHYRFIFSVISANVILLSIG